MTPRSLKAPAMTRFRSGRSRGLMATRTSSWRSLARPWNRAFHPLRQPRYPRRSGCAAPV